jgi:uncharacterized membrane protein
MPVWAIIVVTWVHVLFAIFWFGSLLMLAFILLPAMARVPHAEQQPSLGEFVRRFLRMIPAVAGITILFGFLRGTVFGSVVSLDIAFGTAYGLTWVAALVLAIVATSVGGVLVGGNLAKLEAIPVRANGSSQLAYIAQLRKVRAGTYVTLLFLVAIFTCMMLMRFGY